MTGVSTYFGSMCCFFLLDFIAELCPLQIDNYESAKRSGELFGYPLMIKSKRLAYDGRGNAVAKCEDDLSSAVTGMV